MWVVLVVGWLWPMPTVSQGIFGSPPARWDFEVRRDKITDLPFHIAQVATRRTLVAGQRVEARVGIWCFQGKGTIRVRWGGAAAGSKNLVLEFRFDGEPGHRTKARYVKRSEQETTNVEDLRQFFKGMERSDGFYLRVISDLYGVSEAYFTTRGGREVVAKFRAACPAMVSKSG